MADWSQLPPELLPLISKRLEGRFDVLRFRSVCSSWRSSVPPKLYPLPKHLPSKTQGRCRYSPRNITVNTLYLIRSFQGNPTTGASACWLVKIRDGFDRFKSWTSDPLSASGVYVFEHVKMRALNPFSNYVVKPLSGKFPKILDLSNFQVIELGHEYIGRYYQYIDHPIEPQCRSCQEKVVFLRPSTDSDDFIVLALLDGSAFLRSGENEWVELENEHDFQDIISFDGKLYAIDRKGRTKVIDQSLNVSFLEHVGSSRSRMFLVKSVDDLLAVEKIFLSSGYCDEVVGFRVYRMNEEEQKWEEMESLSDRILFLGVNQSVSAAASDFCWDKGNLIFYVKNHRSSPGIESVFNLETGTDNPVMSCPAYCNLFWSPPEWVTCQESVSSSAQVISNSTHLVPSASPENEYNYYPESKLSLQE